MATPQLEPGGGGDTCDVRELHPARRGRADLSENLQLKLGGGCDTCDVRELPPARRSPADEVKVSQVARTETLKDWS